jgi:hypothetical protein
MPEMDDIKCGCELIDYWNNPRFFGSLAAGPGKGQEKCPLEGDSAILLCAAVLDLVGRGAGTAGVLQEITAAWQGMCGQRAEAFSHRIGGRLGTLLS